VSLEKCKYITNVQTELG